jgi:alpha,alpha-trehalose phosphorylase
MAHNKTLSVEPWCIREVGFDEEILGQTESLFALSNGHIGMRGTLDEGEPHALPGTYLNSVYELRPLPYAEAGYGYPESGQTVINVTDAKIMRLLVEDEPFSLQYGEIRHHERVLDFRKGILQRNVEWISPTGQAVRVTSTRLVSLTQRSVAAIYYTVEALDNPVRIVVQSELVANEQLPEQRKDPRVAAILEAPLQGEDHFASNGMVGLVHQTKQSGLRVGAAMDHIIDGPAGTQLSSDSFDDLGRVTITSHLQPGEKLSITKFIGYGWSARRSLPALRDQVAAAITVARHMGWEELCKEQEEFLTDYWEHADVEIEGDPEIQQAVRLALYECLQNSVRAEHRCIPAKGLTGPGYDGHAFWDTETFLLQVLNFTNPDAAADELRWRHSILPLARERAAELGLAGAAFPWRTIDGAECSGYWPAGTAQFHINADIADAVTRYLAVTDDEEFERTFGLEILVETARLWRSLGHHDLSGVFRIDGVTGPDEYTAVVDNNVFTNLMAQRNLSAAVRVCEKHPAVAKNLGVTDEEVLLWRAAAAAMFVPYDEVLEVHPQSEGFTRHDVWNFEDTPPDYYPLLLHVPYFDLYRKQVVKQADLVLAMFMCPDEFTPEQKLRNFDYYEKITVRDSSLSASTQSIIAAEVGHLDLAYDYLGESALVDLHDLGNNARDGLHMASLAGTWMALVMGFGGMRQHNGSLSFAPRLPKALTKLTFNVTMKGSPLRVEVTPEDATYQVLEGGHTLEIMHHGENIVVEAGRPGTYKIPTIEEKTPPQQPASRAPARRRVSAN